MQSGKNDRIRVRAEYRPSKQWLAATLSLEVTKESSYSEVVKKTQTPDNTSFYAKALNKLL